MDTTTQTETKEEAKFTAGPWEAVRDTNGTGSREWAVRPTGTSLGIAIWLTEADARLMAAAPDLLEALQAIHRGFMDGSIKWAKARQSDSDPYHPANTLMSAALDKALGKE